MPSSPDGADAAANVVTKVAIVPLTNSAATAAMALSQRLQLPLLSPGADPHTAAQYQILIEVSETGMRLQPTGPGASGSVSVDFGSGAMRHRRRSRGNELLGRAVGVGKKDGLAVLDATAGLGRDSFVLADLGCQVALCERNPILAELLHCGMTTALASGDAWLQQALGRMRLHATDARHLSVDDIAAMDVIYLDPMFPERDKSAAVKKEMAVLQALPGTGDDADALFQWALAQDVARVVVKRPPRAPALGGSAPSHCISGKAVRYDVYVLRGLA